jgi:hypothetical protein
MIELSPETKKLFSENRGYRQKLRKETVKKKNVSGFDQEKKEKLIGEEYQKGASAVSIIGDTLQSSTIEYIDNPQTLDDFFEEEIQKEMKRIIKETVIRQKLGEAEKTIKEEIEKEF